jgi:hypothetical protein
MAGKIEEATITIDLTCGCRIVKVRKIERYPNYATAVYIRDKAPKADKIMPGPNGCKEHFPDPSDKLSPVALSAYNYILGSSFRMEEAEVLITAIKHKTLNVG